MDNEIVITQPETSSEAKKADNERMKRLLLRLAFFAGALALNQYASAYIFSFIAYLLGAASLGGDALYLVQWIVNDLSVYVFPMLGAYLLFRGERAEGTNPRYPLYSRLEMPLLFPAMIFAGSAATLLTQLIAKLADSLFSTGEIKDAFEGIAPETGGNCLIFFVFVCIIGPVCEEIIFRKLLLVPLRALGDGFAVLATAVVFGAYHGNLDQFPYAAAVGVFLALAAVRSGSVIPPLILHVVNNVFVMLSSYTEAFFGKDTRLSAMMSNMLALLYDILFVAGIIAVVILIVCKFFVFLPAGATTKKEKRRLVLKSPAVYAAAALLTLLFFV